MICQEKVDSFVTDALTCPITLEIFVDPVLASDGHTYERSAIVEWIKHHNSTSPMTRQPMKIKELKSNRLVKELADKYRSSVSSNIGQELNTFFGDGTLLNSEQKILLNQLFTKEKKWSLIYKGTRDGFTSSDFHRMCNNRGATLTLIQTRNRLFMKNRQMIFGGYTTVPWSSQYGFHHDSQAFLFQFIQNKLTRFNIQSNVDTAVSHCVSSGPIFGFDDIHICHRANENNFSYSRFPDCYEDAEQNGKGRKTFSKSRYFTVSEIEVYKVIV
jgi:hypothetical protein